MNLFTFKDTKIAGKPRRFCEITIEVSIDDPRTDDQRAAVDAARDIWRSSDSLAQLQITLLRAGLDLRISVCGTEGRVTTPAQTKRQALEYWSNYFDENPGEIIAMGQRFNRQFRTAKGAARFVLECDGDTHGIDVHATTESGVLVTESCGQIREELAQWFPEFADLFSLHLSDMVAGAPDQMRALADMPEDWIAEYNGKYGRDYYAAACGWLKQRGILESKHEGWIFVTGDGFIPAAGYKYGSRWVHTVVPVAALERLRALGNARAEECAA